MTTTLTRRELRTLAAEGAAVRVARLRTEIKTLSREFGLNIPLAEALGTMRSAKQPMKKRRAAAMAVVKATNSDGSTRKTTVRKGLHWTQRPGAGAKIAANNRKWHKIKRAEKKLTTK